MHVLKTRLCQGQGCRFSGSRGSDKNRLPQNKEEAAARQLRVRQHRGSGVEVVEWNKSKPIQDLLERMSCCAALFLWKDSALTV